VTVTCERWLWAPYSEIFFEHGHRLVTGTTTFMVNDIRRPQMLADEGDVVVHQALHAGNRGRLVDEVGEAHLDVAGFGLEALTISRSIGSKVLHRDLALVAVEDLDEARHVRALEVVGQADVHVEHGDGVLHAADLSCTLTGWRMDLMPTLLMAIWRVSALLWTSGMAVWGRSWACALLVRARNLN
jgi:hypothetical protein